MEIENIIKYIVKKDYNNIETTINNIQINKDDEYINYLKLIYYILWLLKNDYIDDVVNYCFIRKMSEIINLKYLELNNKELNKFKYNILTYNYIINKTKLNTLDNNLNLILYKFKQSDNKNISKIFKNITLNDSKKIFIEHIKNKLNSFYDLKFLEILIIKDKLIKIIKDKETWEQIHSEEMIHRLSKIYKLLGYKILNFLGIKIIDNKEFLDYNFNEKINYYRDSILKLDISIKFIINEYENRDSIINILEDISLDYLKKKYYKTDDLVNICDIENIYNDIYNFSDDDVFFINN